MITKNNIDEHSVYSYESAPKVLSVAAAALIALAEHTLDPESVVNTANVATATANILEQTVAPAVDTAGTLEPAAVPATETPITAKDLNVVVPESTPVVEPVAVPITTGLEPNPVPSAVQVDNSAIPGIPEPAAINTPVDITARKFDTNEELPVDMNPEPETIVNGEVNSALFASTTPAPAVTLEEASKTVSTPEQIIDTVPVSEPVENIAEQKNESMTPDELLVELDLRENNIIQYVKSEFELYREKIKNMNNIITETTTAGMEQIEAAVQESTPVVASSVQAQVSNPNIPEVSTSDLKMVA